MRVIAGEAKGRRLKMLAREGIRPTSDRVKESLFDIIGYRACGARVLDLYAGTGNLGIEALSRGAAFALFVERASRAAALIRENLAQTGLVARAEVWQTDAQTALLSLRSRESFFDLIFLDPPYGYQFTGEVLGALARGRLMARGGLVIFEHHKKDRLLQGALDLLKVDERRFGDTVLTFFQQKAQP
jgi:16S rRNA (guanine(966)-N(2))-methyltransferase RsmD